MAMNVGGGGGSGEPDVVVDINTTPLIDVMLVLLIMLIITIPIQTHAVKLEMPVGNPPAASTLPEVVNLDVDFDGTVLWNKEVLADHGALEARFRQAAAAPVPPEVHLRPHRLVTYKHVTAVMASAQRLGVTKIGVVGNEQFLD
ncbi:MAG: biopolymer transporter ExbD [Magnetospirillum sp.]|nr:biopolymer transporter ExbD [Magnetospirillum sp.]